jgi:hypothetical protein
MLDSHEWPILAFGVLCGVTAAFVGAWLVLRLAIVDELDPLALPASIGVGVGIVFGAVLVALARRARI